MAIRPPTLKTLYLLVTCCMEESRREILDQVIDRLLQNHQIDSILPYMVAIDNGSTDDTVEVLKHRLGVKVYSTPDNLGYWSAINWVFNNVDLEPYRFIHIIESDHYYYADDLWTPLNSAENCLLEMDDIGGIRLQEYDIDRSDLYNKSLGRGDGRKYAWVSHRNAVTGEPVVPRDFEPTEYENIWVSNFLTVLHGMNRLNTMREVFAELAELDGFSELDFQRKYHERYPRIGVLNGGIFHAKLGFTPHNPRALSGSWSKDVSSIGYRTTRQDTILQYPEGSVVDAWKTPAEEK